MLECITAGCPRQTRRTDRQAGCWTTGVLRPGPCVCVCVLGGGGRSRAGAPLPYPQVCGNPARGNYRGFSPMRQWAPAPWEGSLRHHLPNQIRRPLLPRSVSCSLSFIPRAVAFTAFTHLLSNVPSPVLPQPCSVPLSARPSIHPKCLLSVSPLYPFLYSFISLISPQYLWVRKLNQINK